MVPKLYLQVMCAQRALKGEKTEEDFAKDLCQSVAFEDQGK